MAKKKKQLKDKNLNVLLLDDIVHLGARGEVKKIKAGFYRYLLQLNKIAQVNKSNWHQIENLKLLAGKKVEAGRAQAEMAKEKIDHLVYRAKIKMGEHGEVYSSISKNDIRKFLKGEGVEVQKDQIMLEAPMREVMEKIVEIHLGYGYSGQLKVLIEGEK